MRTYRPSTSPSPEVCRLRRCCLGGALLLTLGLALGCPSGSDAQGTIPLLSSDGFRAVNGKKVVVDGHTVRLVYADGGHIYYTTSANCSNWQSPVVISGNLTGCSAPTIGMDGSGTVGVAFVAPGVGESTVYYTFHPQGGSWSSPVLVAEPGDQPSLQCDATTVHLAYHWPLGIFYATFPANGGPPSGWTTHYAGESVIETPVGDGAPYYFMPSIAVTPAGAIYVATAVSFSGSPAGLGLEVFKRPSGSGSFWPVDYFDTRSVGSDQGAGFNVSATAAANGDIYVVESDQATLPSKSQRTVAAHLRAGTWLGGPLNARFTESDVAVLENTMRVVYADVTDGVCQASAVHRTDYDWNTTYSWTQTLTPVLLVDETLSAGGRTPQALFYSADNCGCDIWAIFPICSPAALTERPGENYRGPVLYYTFDYSTDRGFDSSFHGYEGVLGGAVVQSGVTAPSGHVFGSSLQFQVGNNINEFSTPDALGLNMLSGMTISAWLKPLGPNDTTDPSCSEGTILTKAGSYWFQVDANNTRLELQNEGSGTELAYAAVPSGLTVGQWIHVAVTRSIDGHTVRFYANGAPITTGSIQLTLHNDPGFNVGPITLGNHSFDGYGHCELNGELDEIKIWDYCLRDDEIAAEYNRVITAPLFMVNGGGSGAAEPDPQPVLKRPGMGTALTRAESPQIAVLPHWVMRSRGAELLFGRPRDTNGVVTIVDLAGRVIRTLEIPRGADRLEWDGRDRAGAIVKAGVYFSRLDGQPMSGHVVLVR